MGRYVDRLSADIAACRAAVAEHGGEIPDVVDTIYLGGGTPSLLPVAELGRLFSAIRAEFKVVPKAEATVECAPGTLSEAVIEGLAQCGVNRVSLGVQSFNDQEAASVARLHTREKILSDMEHLRAAGIANINVDLIAGLPHQTEASWLDSVEQAIASGAPHVSVYMLEVDDDSRLGREVMAGGTRYHAHFVPDDDATAGFYETAIARLNDAGIAQYEISNFARPGFESLHNLRYWLRRPYLGFGVDAHSMLPAMAKLKEQGADCVRLAATDSYEGFFVAQQLTSAIAGQEEALEESFFLGLRLNRGVDIDDLRRKFEARITKYDPVIDEMVAVGMLAREGTTVRLTPSGRLLSNEVFEKFILADASREPALTAVPL